MLLNYAAFGRGFVCFLADAFFIACGIAALPHLSCVNLDWRPCWCCGSCDTICNGLGRAGHMESAQKIGATPWWHAIWDSRRRYFAADCWSDIDMSCLVFLWELLLNTFLQGWTWSWHLTEGAMAAQATLQSAPWRTAPDCSIGSLWACWVPTSLQHSWCGLFLPPCLDWFSWSSQIPHIRSFPFLLELENNIPRRCSGSAQPHFHVALFTSQNPLNPKFMSTQEMVDYFSGRTRLDCWKSSTEFGLHGRLGTVDIWILGTLMPQVVEARPDKTVADLSIYQWPCIAALLVHKSWDALI